MTAAMMRFVVTGMAAVLLPVGMGAQAPMDPTSNPATSVNPMNSGVPAPPQPGPANPNGAQPTTMHDSLGAPGLTGRQMLDKQFLMKATEGGIAQVRMGMLATQKGSPEVQELGQKIVDDHTAINKDMANVADEMGVMLPKKMSKEDQTEYEKLSGLSGDEFDKEYLALMLKDHREDVHAFRSEAMNASDQNLQSEAMRAAGTIRQHLQMVTKLAEEKGVPVPPRPPKPAPNQ